MVWPSARLAVLGSCMAVFGVAGAGAAGVPATALARPAPALDGTFFDRELAGEAARLAAIRARPEAISPLLAIASLYDAVPPGAVERVLTETAEAGGTDALVAAHAAFLLSRVEDDRDGEKAGDRRRAGLGFIAHFWVVGPFGDGRAALGEAFGPEHDQGAPDPARRYPGKEREVSWRRANEVVRQGALYR